MPVIEKGGLDEGYEGAIVLDPKCDLYLDNPVACVDYASLYPSSMISENLSHDSKVWTREYDLAGNLIEEWGEKDEAGNYIYDNLPGYEYVDVTYDTYVYRRKNPKAAAEKVLNGHKICRFVQPNINTEECGIMPSILKELLKARKDTRKMIPLETDEFMKNVLDQRQLGYKVTANSLYGQCGAKTSTFYEKDIAACTTATGRKLLTYAKRVIEECYGDKLCDTEKYGPVLTKAEYIYGDSVASWTPIKIRKNTENMIYICAIEELANKFGNNNWITCTEPGKQDKEFCELDNLESWSEKGWTRLYRVIRHKLADHKKMLRVVTNTGLVDVTDDHSLLLSNGTEISPMDCEVGIELLHNPLPYGMNLDLEYLNGDETKYSKYHSQDQVYLANVAALLGTTQIKITDEYDYDYDRDYEYYTDIICIKKQIEHNIDIDEKRQITKIREISYEGYVYDLTTENHHFAAGIGDLIVHNTDSVFFTFNLQTPDGKPIRGKEALEITIELAQEAGHLASSFLKGPHDLEYEKTFMPFCLLSKKRYVGMLYETDPNKCKRKEMGIVLKRRDNAPIVKDIYGGIIDILMKKQNIQEAIDFLKSCLKNIVEEKYSMDKLIITKSLRSGYKNPKCIAHKVLADRITARDPGNKPSSGDRIPFVYMVTKDKKALQGEKIETPTFIIENGLKIDYSFYITNQIMKPVQQVFALVLEKIWEMNKKIPKIKQFKKVVETLKREYLDNLEKFEEKLESMRCKEIKTLLFDEYLRETNNEKAGVQSVTKFFVKK
jgi:DNA polymerase elongation subunit (family B)